MDSSRALRWTLVCAATAAGLFATVGMMRNILGGEGPLAHLGVLAAFTVIGGTVGGLMGPLLGGLVERLRGPRG